MVVSDVSAESAEENDEATMPRVKNTATGETAVAPPAPMVVETKAGSSSSPLTPVNAGTIVSSTPRARNSRFTGTKATP